MQHAAALLTTGWADLFGSPKISEDLPLVNIADSEPINNDTGQLCKLSGANGKSDTDCNRLVLGI